MKQENKTLQKKTVRDLKDLSQANEKITLSNKQWRKDVDAIAVVTSCMSEYMSMQNAIDKDFISTMTQLVKDIETKFR